MLVTYFQRFASHFADDGTKLNPYPYKLSFPAASLLRVP